jgi:hemoglobin/transferrin/lactoferrin receptor protein
VPPHPDIDGLRTGQLIWRAKDITFTASVDTLMNRYYRPYTILESSTDGTTQNDVLSSSLGRDTVYKAGLKIHLGRA